MGIICNKWPLGGSQKNLLWNCYSTACLDTIRPAQPIQALGRAYAQSGYFVPLYYLCIVQCVQLKKYFFDKPALPFLLFFYFLFPFSCIQMIMKMRIILIKVMMMIMMMMVIMMIMKIIMKMVMI